jgi:hypothetical protein
MVESIWSKDVQRGEAGQFAAWLSTYKANHLVTVVLLEMANLFFTACMLRTVVPPTTPLLPLSISSLAQTYAKTRGNQRSPTSFG